MGATKFRARFDPVVTFSNGGGLRAGGFRVDVPGPDVTEPDAASLFIASLNLLMADSAELGNLSVFAEPHTGTRGARATARLRDPSGGGSSTSLTRSATA